MSRQTLNRFLSIIIVCNILITRNNAVPIFEGFENRASSTFNGKKDIITDRFEIINSKIISIRSSRGKSLHPRELVTILGGIATTVVGSALAAGIAPVFSNIGKSIVGDGDEEDLVEEPSEPDEFDEDQDQETEDLDRYQPEEDEKPDYESNYGSAVDMNENVDEDRPTKKFGKIGE